MRKHGRWLIVLLLLTAGAALADSDPELSRLTQRFAGALAADDVRAFDALAAAGAARAPEWLPLMESIEANDCPVIRSCRIVATEPSASGLRLELEIDATVIAAGRSRTPRTFPRRWSLALVRGDRGWAIESVEDSATRRAREIAQVPPDEQVRLVFRSDLDQVPLVRALATAGSTMGEEGRATVAQAILLSRLFGDRAAESHCVSEMGVLDINVGNLAAALARADEALQFALASGDRDQIALATMQLGTTNWLAGNLDTAVDLLRKTADMMDAVDTPRTPIAAAYMQSYIETSRGRYREAMLALEFHDAALARYPWMEGEVNSSFSWTRLHSAMGNTSVALADVRESLRRAERLGDRRLIAYASANLGGAASEMGLLPEALAGYERALRLASDAMTDDDRATIYTEMARASLGLDRLQDAERHAGEAQCWAARNPDYRLQAMVVLGEVWVAQHRAGDALNVLAAAEELARDSQVFDGWDALLAARGKALRQLGRSAEAVAVLREAVQSAEARLSRVVTDEASQTNTAANRLDAYRELIDLLVEQRRPREALMVADQMSARTLGGVLREGRVDLASVMNAEDRDRVRRLEADLNESNRLAMLVRGRPGMEERARARVAAARLALSGVLSEINLHYGRPRAPHFEPGTLGDPRALIADQSAIVIQYLWTDRSLLVFAITRSGDRLHVTVRRVQARPAQIAARIDRFVSNMAARDAGIASQSRGLYDLLIGPVAPLLASRRTICFIPDQSLWRVPMHALRDPSSRYLIERAAVLYAPSLTFLAAHQGGSSPVQRVLALGNPSIAPATTHAIEPVYRDVQLQPLPDAEREALAIARIYGPRRSRAYVGSEATEEMAKRSAADYDVLHFAVHGIIDNASPMFSALVLGSGGDDDGLLEARELLQMKLKARLVVLSACETSGGAVRPGEGVIGLAWAVMMAGCRTAVVSQWKVVSESTSGLMIDFHRDLARRDGRHPAAALRSAQLHVMRDPRFGHPFYWAPFVVIGAGW